MHNDQMLRSAQHGEKALSMVASIHYQPALVGGREQPM
jgi:hypothetical protein